jgi:hypothetical protein
MMYDGVGWDPGDAASLGAAQRRLAEIEAARREEAAQHTRSGRDPRPPLAHAEHAARLREILRAREADLLGQEYADALESLGRRFDTF